MDSNLKQRGYLRRWRQLGALLSLVVLAGCVNPYGGAPMSSKRPPSAGPYPAPVEQSGPDVVAPHEVAPPPPVTILPGNNESRDSNQAVDQLLEEGWDLYDQGRHDASISVAERALRIDRHRPDLYQLLSRNYLATLQLQQAEQLARQGLSIGSVTADQRAALEQLLLEINEKR